MNNNDEIHLEYTAIQTPLPDFIYKSLKHYCDNSNTYHPQPKELIERLAKKHNVTSEMIFLTMGADEGIRMFALTFGSNAYVFTPAYIDYLCVEEYGGKLNRIYCLNDNGFEIRTEKIDKATLIYLANPNNPVGFTDKKKVVELIENNKDAIVVIDEAYGGFVDLSVIDKVSGFSNLAVLRSFSKDYGMAGNRMGYFVAQPELIAKVKGKTQWTNISYLQVGAAMAALDHEEYFIKLREGIHQRREDFVNFLRENKYKVFDSLINAVLIKFDTDELASKFVEYLDQNSIIVSQGNGNANIGLDNSFVRIAIGSEEQMDKVKKVIGRYS